MITFPTILKNELPYSVISRAISYYGSADLLSHLINCKFSYSLYGFDDSLLISKYSSNQNLSLTDIILNNTIAPLILPFYRCYSNTTIKKIDCNSLYDLVVYRKEFARHLYMSEFFGKINSRFHSKNNLYLRFCRDCAYEQKYNFGFYYWMRDHTSDFIYVCPIHKTALYRTEIKISDIKKYRLYIPLTDYLINHSEQIKIKSWHINLANYANDLLYHPTIIMPDIQYFRNYYINIMKKYFFTSYRKFFGSIIISSMKSIADINPDTYFSINSSLKKYYITSQFWYVHAILHYVFSLSKSISTIINEYDVLTNN